MKNIRSPKYITQLSDSWVLWFETSNQYLVISHITKALLDLYLHSESEQDFNKHIKSVLNISEKESKIYYAEITAFLETANTSVESEPSDGFSIPSIKDTDITQTYRFGNTSIAVRYDSLVVRDLIHPQWAHAIVRKEDRSNIVFDIFEKDNYLYLFKNKQYINHYLAKNFHFLQGQFALQLINTLYHKDESDWMATFHASTVCNNQEAIMIIGDSGNGKSTLSAVLMAHGIDVLADDFTPLLAENAEAYRFPSGISVKEGAFSMLKPLFQDFDEFPVYRSTSKPVHIKYIPPISRFGEGISHVPCHKIVFVNYDAQAASEMKAVATDQILPTLIPESWLSPLASNAKIFLDWLKDVQCYELNYSDNAIAVSEFKTLFNS